MPPTNIHHYIDSRQGKANGKSKRLLSCLEQFAHRREPGDKATDECC